MSEAMGEDEDSEEQHLRCRFHSDLTALAALFSVHSQFCDSKTAEEYLAQVNSINNPKVFELHQ